MITFCVICYGCRGKQINRCTIAITFFIKPPRSYFPNTRLVLCGFFFFSISVHGASPLKNTECVSYQKLMRNAASDCTWGIFIKHLPCHCLAKYCANSPPRNVQRMSAKLATDTEFLPESRGKKEMPFSQLQCSWQAPEFEVIIYLICSPNKLLTLVFVPQRASF